MLYILQRDRGNTPLHGQCDEKAELFYYSLLEACDGGESNGPSKRTNSHLSKTLFQFQVSYIE